MPEVLTASPPFTLEFSPQGPRCRLGIVVLNYKTPELALQAARSVAEAVDPTRDCVTIVDNRSPDDSVARLRDGLGDDLPHVRIVQSTVNGGFSSGNNVGIASMDAEAYVLLNSDTIVRPGAMSTLWEALQSQPDIGLVSPRLEDEDGTPQISCFRYHTPPSELIRGAQTGPITKLLAPYEVALEVYDARVDVPWTSFACVMIRREVLERIGLLDHGYFMYYEDADFCRRAKAVGYRVVHEPAGRVVHLRGKSSPVKEATRLKKQRPAYYYAARSRYFRESFGPLGPPAANVCWTLGRAVSKAREVLTGRARSAVERELQDNWTASSKPWKLEK